MKTGSQLTAAATIAVLDGLSASAEDRGASQKEALEKAFEALKTFDWGTGITIPAEGKPPEDAHVLAAIDDAVVAAHGDAAAERALEARLVAVLKTDSPRAAKDFVCRKLRTFGTAQCVPALAALLLDKDLSHMARYALELNLAPQAAAALREALPKAQGALKVGILGSLGKRRDAASSGAILPLLADADKAIAAAAASALGAIGTPQAASALRDCLKQVSQERKASVTDACLVCAERLLADGKKAEATAVYKSLSGEDQPPHVRLAAARGLLSAAGKKN